MAGRRRWVCPAVTWILALTVALATAGLQFVVRPQLADDPLVGTGRLDHPAVADPPPAVLPDLGAPTATVAPASLAARLDALPREGLGDVVALVVDARTGQELYRAGSGARTPASSLKVLSALVAIDVLGPDRTFATTSPHQRVNLVNEKYHFTIGFHHLVERFKRLLDRRVVIPAVNLQQVDVIHVQASKAVINRAQDLRARKALSQVT